MAVYSRTPAGSKIIQDANLRASLTLYVPSGEVPDLNGGEDAPGALFISTDPLDKGFYYKVDEESWIRAASLEEVNAIADEIRAELNDYSKSYEHPQSEAASTWTIHHNLGKKCTVQVFDENDEVVITRIVQTDENTAHVLFSTATAGYALCTI